METDNTSTFSAKPPPLNSDQLNYLIWRFVYSTSLIILRCNANQLMADISKNQVTLAFHSVQKFSVLTRAQVMEKLPSNYSVTGGLMQSLYRLRRASEAMRSFH